MAPTAVRVVKKLDYEGELVKKYDISTVKTFSLWVKDVILTPFTGSINTCQMCSSTIPGGRLRLAGPFAAIYSNFRNGVPCIPHFLDL